ncbi:MAG: ATP-binding protein [Phycisphaerae bacterium]|nr:ATP-binding protein [Phycisphaerae bacterium]MDD5381161.1 ATP-binding protein [Phycisphaerae bacterium]
MSEKPNKSGQSDNPGLTAIKAENERLRRENEQLRLQADSLATANANAVELMVELEKLNDNLQAEVKKREQTEKELEEHQHHLENLVAERTSDLKEINSELLQEIYEHEQTEKRLAQAGERAKAVSEVLAILNKDLKATVEQLTIANRELVDFTHVIAHDLRRPLRGIGILAEWIVTDYADKLDEEGKKQIELLMNRVQLMYNQITSISTYSKIGWGIYEDEEIDSNRLVKEIIRKIATPENIQIIVSDKLPTFVYKKVYLAQIFQNLLSNAVKYMDKSNGRITVDCVEEEDFWKFSIADNGIGIEGKYFNKIFKIFQTLPQGEQQEGIGVGLAIVKKAVEKSNGRVWVESTPGKGTTFFFTLQKHKAAVETAAVV